MSGGEEGDRPEWRAKEEWRSRQDIAIYYILSSPPGFLALTPAEECPGEPADTTDRDPRTSGPTPACDKANRRSAASLLDLVPHRPLGLQPRRRYRHRSSTLQHDTSVFVCYLHKREQQARSALCLLTSTVTVVLLDSLET